MKKQGVQRPERSLANFRRMIQVCNFQDLKHVGDAFSWVGKHRDYDVKCYLVAQWSIKIG